MPESTSQTLASDEPANPLEALAWRTIWWESPREAKKRPKRLLTYVMARGTWDEIEIARQHFSHRAFVDALTDPLPGIFDLPSWHYWHRRLGLSPIPPLPERYLP